MKQKNSLPMRVAPEIKDLFEDVRKEKIKSGECEDLRKLSDRRLSLAVTRIPNIKNILVKSKFRRL